jgi:hypothetical protein
MPGDTKFDDKGETTNREALFTILRLFYRFERTATAQLGELRAEVKGLRAELVAARAARQQHDPT